MSQNLINIRNKRQRGQYIQFFKETSLIVLQKNIIYNDRKVAVKD